MVSTWNKDGRMQYLSLASGQAIRVNTLYIHNYCSGIFNEQGGQNFALTCRPKMHLGHTLHLLIMLTHRLTSRWDPLHSFLSLLVRALGNSQKWIKQPNTVKRKFYAASNFMKILQENLSLQPSWGSYKFRFFLPQINYFGVALQAWSCLPKRWWWNSSREVTRPPEDDSFGHFTVLSLFDRR